MTKPRITDLNVLGLCLGGLFLVEDRVTASAKQIGSFIGQHMAQAHPIPLHGRTGTLGIRG